MKTYKQIIKTWCTSGPSGASMSKSPGPEWRVAGFGVAGADRRTYATIVYERESDSTEEPTDFRAQPRLHQT